jgi:two-component system KDP operon response regulator KdpE
MTANRKPDVLIVDDEPQIRRLLGGTLGESGFAVSEAGLGRLALGQIALRSPDAIILDLGLPDVPGLDVLRALRPICSAPVLVLSVQDQEETKIAALDAGADDYVVKPYSNGEILARLRALLRRPDPAAPDTRFRFGPIEVDFVLRRVLREGRPVKLSMKEYELLRLLVENRDKVMTHGDLLRELWGPNADGHTNYLRVYMMRLRQKLGDEANAAGHFQTEAGIGYRFVSEPAP